MCEEMYFSLIRFSYMAVAGLFGDWNPFSRNSRFGSFNSRQAGVNSRLGRPRELGRKVLIRLYRSFCQMVTGRGKIDEIPVRREEAGTTGLLGEPHNIKDRLAPLCRGTRPAMSARQQSEGACRP